jgi:selenocysteine lyase/cysteine desulfurase
MDRLGLKGTVRASFACTSTMGEVEQLEQALRKALRMLGLS